MPAIPEGEKAREIVVFSIRNDAVCAECGQQVWKGNFLRVEEGKPLCLECADLGHLVYLPSGNAALTRRARKHSSLCAVVVRFSRTRKRYEREGLLVEPAAVERAEQECLSDEDQREAARRRAAQYREHVDEKYLAEFTKRLRERYPRCPAEEADAIARHACQKYSGRVGRSAAAKELQPEAIDLAVRAHVRHAHTGYDALMARGHDRVDARAEVKLLVEDVLECWR